MKPGVLMDKKIEKVIDKCLILLEKGYNLDECIRRFEGYHDEIIEYFKTIRSIKDLEVIIPEKDYRNKSLASIMSEANRRKTVSLDKANAKAAIQQGKPGAKKRLLLRPAIIFMVFLILAVFSFTGTLFASQETIPGQTLYPLKKSLENFKLIIYPDNKKDDLHFQFLNNRIDEADTLLMSGYPDTDILVEGLIDEIDGEYQICKQYNYFSTLDESSILDSINNIKNRYRNRYKNNQDKDKGSTGDNSANNDHEEDPGYDQQNTGNGTQQNKNEKGNKNRKNK
jgi:hypothetical protein